MLRAPQTPSFSAVTRAICLSHVHHMSPILGPELLREATLSVFVSPAAYTRPQNLVHDRPISEPILTKLK